MSAKLTPVVRADYPAPLSVVDGNRFDATIALFEVTRLLRAAFGERMQALGLTGASWRILFILSHHDGQTQAALARKLEITPVAVGEALERLEKTGHVERRADPDDRRKRRVYLTERSISELPSMIATAETLQAEVFDGVDDAELAALKGVLGKLRVRLHETKIEDADPEDEGDA